jgi:hypothetical protein
MRSSNSFELYCVRSRGFTQVIYGRGVATVAAAKCNQFISCSEVSRARKWAHRWILRPRAAAPQADLLLMQHSYEWIMPTVTPPPPPTSNTRHCTDPSGHLNISSNFSPKNIVPGVYRKRLRLDSRFPLCCVHSFLFLGLWRRGKCSPVFHWNMKHSEFSFF